MRIAAAFLLACALAACGRAGAYPASYKTNFLQSCQVAGSSESHCTCIWDRIEKEVPRAEFDALEQAMSHGASTPLKDRIGQFALQCPA
jgi:hypothetical protein